MDGDKASRFVSSLVKSIQALCNGYIDFSSSIEVIGHIHLNIDRSVKLDYVLTEEVSKSISEGATVFASHSYHSHPPSSLSSKSASDTSGRNRQKQSSNVSHGDEEDSSGFRSEVHNTPIKSDIHSHKRSNESYVDSGDLVSPKHENRQKSCLTSDSSERRRRSIPLPSQPHRSSPPAAKRSRQSDYNPDLNPQEFEVIEIKEEPDDEPAVFFGNSSAGQDLQTPDFSNVVMESLDRVGQVEGTNLVGSGGDGGQMQQQQQQPFPVMMHSNSGMPSSSASSSGPGPSLSDPQDQSFASTSGTLSEAELRLLRRRQKNAQHARTYRQRAKLSEEKHQMLKEKAKERQRRYIARMKERQAYLQGLYAQYDQGFYPT